MNRLAEIFLSFLKLMNLHHRDFHKVQIELVKQGYTLVDIEASLEWYFGEIHGSPEGRAAGKLHSPSLSSIRLFTLEEDRYLSSAGKAYLIEMLHTGAISFREAEEILEYLKKYLIEDASAEDIKDIMEDFRSIDLTGQEGAEDSVDFKIRYFQ